MDIENRGHIELLIKSFYHKVIDDQKIGFFFTDIAKLNLEQHLPIMYDFWESTLLGKHSYKGNPIEVHQKLNSLHKIKKEHFDHWVQMFCNTVDDLFEGTTAQLAKNRAQSIATVMQIKIQTDYRSSI